MYDDYMGVPGLFAPGTTPNPSTTNVPIQYDKGIDYNGVPGLTERSAIVMPTPPSVEASLRTGDSGSSTNTTVVTSVPIKVATPQYVNFDQNILDPISEGLASLIFEQIAGTELLISNNRNFVNTANISYQPIVNISDFKNTYDPKKIIALQETSDVYFLNFIINLLTRIPDVPTTDSTNGTNVYLTNSNNIVIETKDNEPDERVEIQILSGGTIYNDTLGVI